MILVTGGIGMAGSFADELPNKRFYAQSWRYSGEYLKQRLDFRPLHRWQDTLAEIVATTP